MSVERSFEAWEEVQRHGQDLADWLAQGFTGLIQMNAPPFAWPDPPTSKLFDLEFPSQNFGNRDFGFATEKYGIDGVSAIFDIGHRIGQAGADFLASLNGLAQQFLRTLPTPFKHEDTVIGCVRMEGDKNRQRSDVGISTQEDLGTLSERLREYGFAENDTGSGGLGDDKIAGFKLSSAAHLGRRQGIINITSTYDSRTQELEGSLVARGDLWRAEGSRGGSTSGNENSSLFLVQLGPLLFVRDSSLLLPVHLSKQDLLWYGYDRKSFVDLQFPNGQLTYVSGEGLTTSAFLPICGGLLQAEGQYPGEMRFSFSCKNKWGTRITPMVHWPDKSFTLGLAQAFAWHRSGFIVRPTIQFSVRPTFGGSNPGWQAELIHSVKEQLSLLCGCAFTTHPSAFASISIGRSKWNGNVGTSSVVLRVDTPLSGVGRPSFSVQINSGIEF